MQSLSFIIVYYCVFKCIKKSGQTNWQKIYFKVLRKTGNKFSKMWAQVLSVTVNRAIF